MVVCFILCYIVFYTERIYRVKKDQTVLKLCMKFLIFICLNTSLLTPREEGLPELFKYLFSFIITDNFDKFLTLKYFIFVSQFFCLLFSCAYYFTYKFDFLLPDASRSTRGIGVNNNALRNPRLVKHFLIF